MTEENQKPTIAEQYACAVMRGTSSSSLIMAAGLQRDRAGVLLLRLRAEYDTVRGELERAGQIAPRGLDRARVLRQEAARLQKAERWIEAETLVIEAEAIQPRTKEQVKTAHAVILVALTALQAARQELGAMAVRMGANPKRPMAPDTALRLAGRVLDVWLDEACHRCDGTGRIGNRYIGDRERECPTCKGSGHRREIMGDSLTQTLFAGNLLAEVQRQVAAAAAGIKAAIHADSGPSKPMHPELVRRLAELRGEQAATD